MRNKGKRPKVTVNCVADHYAGPGCRIIEFSSEAGGGLIAFQVRHGKLQVEVYRADKGVLSVLSW